jgi:hypothetical protein
LASRRVVNKKVNAQGLLLIHTLVIITRTKKEKKNGGGGGPYVAKDSTQPFSYVEKSVHRQAQDSRPSTEFSAAAAKSKLEFICFDPSFLSSPFLCCRSSHFRSNRWNAAKLQSKSIHGVLAFLSQEDKETLYNDGIRSITRLELIIQEYNKEDML